AGPSLDLHSRRAVREQCRIDNCATDFRGDFFCALNSVAHTRFKADDFPQLPSTVVMGTDIDKTISSEIIRNMKLENPNLPVILVADTFNRVVFMSQGYSIGLGEQLVKVINQL
ncbi:MAG: hypothetical protein IKC85_01215, partial [Bacteroidaceae bacterium]|nr:hypothetical protein [Bacteroidaceae bacterium]